jgi:hypothetical protein
MNQAGKEVTRVNNIMKLTCEQKTTECEETVDFFYRLCDMCDVAFDIWEVERKDLPYFVCSLSLRNFLESQASLFGGAYNSAGRALRWLYEANLAGAAACIKPSLLDEAYEDSESLTSDEFVNWLDRYDNREVQLSRRNIFDSCSLPTEQLNVLYADLCKYSHISKMSFNREETHPNLHYLPDRFDETFEIMTKTMDFTLLMESKMVLCWNHGTVGALKYMFNTKNPLNRYFPMTTTLINSLP